LRGVRYLTIGDSLVEVQVVGRDVLEEPPHQCVAPQVVAEGRTFPGELLLHAADEDADGGQGEGGHIWFRVVHAFIYTMRTGEAVVLRVLGRG